MPYPPRGRAQHNYAADDASATPVSGERLSTDLANVWESLNQTIDFVRSLATADKKWQPSETLNQSLLEGMEFVATAGQTQFDFTAGVVSDPSKDIAKVLVDGVQLSYGAVTLAADSVTIPAQSGGETVQVELFNGAASLAKDLASNLANLGASLIGIEDVDGAYVANNVEDALLEIAATVGDVIQQLGVASQLIRADGSVPFVADQPMSGHGFTGCRDAISPDEFATLRQLNALSAVYGDLGQLFLPLLGGAMSGQIDMQNNPIYRVATALVDSSGPNWGQVKEADALKFDKAGGAFEGPVNFAQNQVDGVPTATATGQPVPFEQVQEIVDEAVSDASAGLSDGVFRIGGAAGLYSFPSEAECPCEEASPDFTKKAIYEFDNLDMSGINATLKSGTIFRISGDLTWRNAVIEVSQKDSSLVASSSSLMVHLPTSGEDETNAEVPNVDKFGSGGAGGRGGGSDYNPGTYGGLSAYELSISKRLWRFFWGAEGGKYNSGSVTGSGGGTVVFHVDGNVELEGTEIRANAKGFSAGGGSVIIVCKGVISGGDGVTISCLGAPGKKFGDGDKDYAGGGGGYISLVADDITGTWYLNAPGASNGTNSDAGTGWGGVVELVRSNSTDSAAFNTDVAAGAIGTEGFVGEDGEVLEYSLPMSQIIQSIIK